jgi:hypothetical protein
VSLLGKQNARPISKKFCLCQFEEDEESRVAERRAWSRKEDDAIVRLVGAHGTKKWAIIAQEVTQSPQ